MFLLLLLGLRDKRMNKESIVLSQLAIRLIFLVVSVIDTIDVNRS